MKWPLNTFASKFAYGYRTAQTVPTPNSMPIYTLISDFAGFFYDIQTLVIKKNSIDKGNSGTVIPVNSSIRDMDILWRNIHFLNFFLSRLYSKNKE
jgi:hypothetical protein